MQKGVSNLRMSIEVKKKSATDGESFWLRTVSTKLPALSFLGTSAVRCAKEILL